MQAFWGDYAIHNGTTRFITSDFTTDTTGDVMTVSLGVLLQGTTVAEFQNVRRSFEAEIVRNANRRLRLTLDTGAGTSYLVDAAPGDGTYIETRGLIKSETMSIPTATSERMAVVFECIVRRATTGGQAAQVPSTIAALPGLSGTIAVHNQYSAGRLLSRDITGFFETLFDGGAFGPFTIASIASGGAGLSVLSLSGSPTVPAFSAGDRAVLSGMTPATLNGTWDVTATDNMAKTITIAAPFVSNGTGSVTMGRVKTGAECYAAARPTLLTVLMECGNDGSQGTTVPITLIGEQTENGDAGGTTFAFLLRGQVQPASLPTGVRDFKIAVQQAVPAAWNPAGGQRPILVTARVSAAVSRDVATAASTISAVEAYAVSIITGQIGGGTVLASQIENDEPTNTIVMTINMVCRNVSVLEWRESESVNTLGAITTWPRSDGTMGLQVSPSGGMTVVTRTAQRIGVGPVTPAEPSSVLSTPRGQLVPNGSAVTRNAGPMTMGAFVNVYDITAQYSYLVVRSGSDSGGGGGGGIEITYPTDPGQQGGSFVAGV